MRALSGDVVVACADLVGRSGAASFELAWTCPHVPDVEDDHSCAGVTWNATALWRGRRIVTDEHRSPTTAAMALAERLLSGATCRCRRPVTLSDGKPGCCRWRLMGARWEPGCDVEPIKVPGERGDVASIERAFAAHNPTRRERRAARRGRRP